MRTTIATAIASIAPTVNAEGFRPQPEWLSYCASARAVASAIEPDTGVGPDQSEVLVFPDGSRLRLENPRQYAFAGWAGEWDADTIPVWAWNTSGGWGNGPYTSGYQIGGDFPTTELISPAGETGPAPVVKSYRLAQQEDIPDWPAIRRACRAPFGVDVAKIRRRVEDALRKAQPSKVVALAHQLGVRIE